MTLLKSIDKKLEKAKFTIDFNHTYISIKKNKNKSELLSSSFPFVNNVFLLFFFCLLSKNKKQKTN